MTTGTDFFFKLKCDIVLELKKIVNYDIMLALNLKKNYDSVGTEQKLTMTECWNWKNS